MTHDQLSLPLFKTNFTTIVMLTTIGLSQIIALSKSETFTNEKFLDNVVF